MIKFRPINNEEKEVLKTLGGEFEVDIEQVFRDKTILVGEGKRKEVFITNKATNKQLNRMQGMPYFAGLYIGDIKGKKFLLGLEGANIISKYSNKKVVVDKKAEQLVLYGRDIFSKSVRHLYKEADVGDRILIVNENNECLGIGALDKGEVLVENIMDRGWYLRKGE
ncbi:MAG: PUA domain-containing protein [Candidatus Hydrothermarchaeales archaeon]